MATTQENDSAGKGLKDTKGQGNAEGIDREASSKRDDIEKGENHVSNGTESTPREPGIARVGNTSPGDDEKP